MGKPALQSTTIIGALIALLAAAAPIFGWSISETDQAAMRTIIESGLLVVSNAIAIMGALVAIWGRLRAQQQITGVIKAAPAPALGP